MKANYHTHTKWCNHAKGEAEDYILEAIRCGLEEIAITDHVPRIDNEDPQRMRWEEFEEYNALLDKAIEKYKHQITIYKGFECEYEAKSVDFYKKLINEYNYTVMVLGQHSFGSHREHFCFRPLDDAAVLLYADTVCIALETGLFSFLAHPDVFLYGHPQWNEACEVAIRKIFTTCERLNVPVEINGFGYLTNRPYPAKEVLEISKEYRLIYLINSDAHRPERVCNESIHELEEMVKEMGIEVTELLPNECFKTPQTLQKKG